MVSFLGGTTGEWQVTSQLTLVGPPLPDVARLDVAQDTERAPEAGGWRLRGVVSNLRYTTRPEVTELSARSPTLGRPESRCAAMIALRKTAAWWELPQDERRAIFEEQSRHTSIGLEYLPAIARRLHHSRNIGEAFDFLTWFEYAPADAAAFDVLVARLRASAEWQFVDREIDLRLSRATD